MSALPAAALADPVTALALCWKLTRGDGVVMGFTSHDRDLLNDGVHYAARPGMTPSAVSHSADLSGDGMEVAGPLSSAGLRVDDLESGRWEGARVELFACSWQAPGEGKLVLTRGSIGSVMREGPGFGTSFRAELLTELAALEEVQPLRLSPTCRAELGDRRCGVDLAQRRVDAGATGWSGCTVKLEAVLPDPERFAHGRLRWVSGPLTGVDRRIALASSSELVLEDPLPDGASAPGRIRLFEGCDKRFATCSARFSNALAFDGEPHVPGTDALVRYGDR